MYQLFTQNKRIFGEVVSVLQKHIRRGEEREAMKCALELLPKYEKYFWRRLMVIALEDIGPAAPEVHSHLRDLRETYFEFRAEDRRGSELLVLSQAILLMCRAPKCRITDNFGCVCRKEWTDAKGPEIPDYALDGHTARGKQKGRGMEFFFAESAKLNNKSDYSDPYEKTAIGYWMNGWKGGPLGPPARQSKNGKEGNTSDLPFEVNDIGSR